MKNPRADALVVFGEQSPRGLFEHDQTGPVGLANLAVGVIDAVGGVEVQERPVDQDRGVGGVVRIGPRLRGDVESPEDIGVQIAQRVRVFVGGRCEAGLILERPVVAVRHAVDVQTHDDVAAGDGIGPVALDGHRAGVAGPRPIQIDILLPDLLRDKLPAQRAVGFLQTKRDAAVAGVVRIPRADVVGADEDLAGSDHRRRVGLGAQIGLPPQVRPGSRIEAIGQARLEGDLVAAPRLTPLRLVSTEGGGYWQ
jgi:hypothetical protein